MCCSFICTFPTDKHDFTTQTNDQKSILCNMFFLCFLRCFILSNVVYTASSFLYASLFCKAIVIFSRLTIQQWYFREMVRKDRKIVFASMQVLLYFGSTFFCKTYFGRTFFLSEKPNISWSNLSPKTTTTTTTTCNTYFSVVLTFLHCFFFVNSFALNKDLK